MSQLAEDRADWQEVTKGEDEGDDDKEMEEDEEKWKTKWVKFIRWRKTQMDVPDCKAKLTEEHAGQSQL